MKIDKNWRIDPDGTHNCILVFSEEKEVQDKKTGEKKVTTVETNYYRPSMSSALKGYLEKELEASQDVKDCVRIIEETFIKIERLCS